MHHSVLQNIVTKDIATEAIKTSLLNARSPGQQQLEVFIQERLVNTADISAHQHPVYDPIAKNKAPTFDDLYKVVQQTSDKKKNLVLKTDQKFLQRLVAAYASGRAINLDNVLNHELLPVPISLAEMAI